MKIIITSILACMLTLPTVAFAQEVHINVMSYTNPHYEKTLNSSQAAFTRPQVNINIARLQNTAGLIAWKKRTAEELRKTGKYMTWIGLGFVLSGVLGAAIAATAPMYIDENPSSSYSSSRYRNRANTTERFVKYPSNPIAILFWSGIAQISLGSVGIIAGGTMWGVANNRLREIYTGSGAASATPTSYSIQ